MKIVFLHGLGQTARSWENVQTQVPEMKGECPDCVSGASTYQEVFDRVERSLADEPICLCGLSLGAMIALDYAARHQERVHSLILIGVQYKVPTMLIDVQNVLFRFMPRSAFQRSGLSKEQMIGLARSMRKLDFSESLQKIRCPVTLVCGEKDFANLKAAKELQRKLPDAKLYIIPGVGHEVNQTAPEALARIIREAVLPQFCQSC